MDLNEIYNYLIDYEIVSEEALNLVLDIVGNEEETYNSVIYAKTEYRDIEQYLMYEDIDTYNEYYGNEEEENEEE